jgi:hypothetical protein
MSRLAKILKTVAMAGALAATCLVSGAGTASASSVSPADVCFLPAANTYWNHSVYYICGTQMTQISRPGYSTQEVIIGSDFYVYRDGGGGWTRLQNGRATNNRPSYELGIFFGVPNAPAGTIDVLGTDYYYWCDTFLAGGGWSGWSHCP